MQLGPNPSYIWRCILWGRQVLQKGMRWRIEGGEDSRLPKPETFKPISAPTLHLDSTVASLIDSENQWNVMPIKQHFREKYAERILQIPTPSRQIPD